MRVFGVFRDGEWQGKLGVFTDKKAATQQIKLYQMPGYEYSIREMDMILNSPSVNLKKIESNLQESTYVLMEYFKYRNYDKSLNDRYFSELKKFWLYLLPSKFKTNEAIILAQKLGIARRTVFYALKQAWTMEKPILWKIAAGEYQKTRDIRGELSDLLKSMCQIMNQQ